MIINKEGSEIYCHDCKKRIETEGEEIKDGKMLVYDNNGEKITIAKCDVCYSENPGLTNFQECEVYSRVVGYYRPVQQWNKGKEQEFKERFVYSNPVN